MLMDKKGSYGMITELRQEIEEKRKGLKSIIYVPTLRKQKKKRKINPK